MEDKRKLNLFAVLFVGLFASICVCLLAIVFLQGQTNVWQDIEIMADIIACAIALIYLIEGYTKDNYKKYKLFMIVTTINALAVTVLSLGEKSPIISLVMCGAAFVVMYLLTFSKDFGRKNSCICCGILVVIRLAGLISNLAMGNNNLTNIILFVSQLSLAILVCTAVYAKYVDKAARGRD